MYAKLINSKLYLAPRTITLGQTHYNPTPMWWITENGYKPVRFTDPPEWEGYYPEECWEETETEIIQKWILNPIETEE